MSIEYVLEKEIAFKEVFDGRLDRYGIREEYVDGSTTDDSRALTDGQNYLWVYGNEMVIGLKRYGANSPGGILEAIAETFNSNIYSEFDPQYWGYETQEAWDAAEDARNERSKVETYVEIMKSVRGEPSKLTPGTIGETWGKIAGHEISKNPELALPERMDELMNIVYEGSIVKWEPPNSLASP